MAPATPKTDVVKPTDTAPAVEAIAGVKPDQRDLEIASLSERLAAQTEAFNKLSERCQLAEMELEDRGEKRFAGEPSGEDPEEARLVRVAALFAKQFAEVLGIAPKLQGKQPKVPLEDKFKGTKEYTVGPGRAFRGGKVLKPGTLVQITNQRPARDWVFVRDISPGAKPAPAVQGVPAPDAQPTGERANDRSIGQK